MTVTDDGFKWVENVIPGGTGRNPTWTLVNPDGHNVAHVYRARMRWTAVWNDGRVIDEVSTCRKALVAVENLARPCAHTIDTHWSHGIVHCDNSRQPGTPYCPAHQPTDEEN